MGYNMTTFQSVVCMLKGTSTKTVLFSKVLRTILASWMLVMSSPTLFAQSLNSSEPAAAKPKEKTQNANVIVIFCDDLGYGELPAYRRLYKGADELTTAIGSFTPNLDRLANEGIVCTRAYAHNWCAPSRQSLLSGLWQMRKSAFKGQPWIGRHMRNAGLKTAQFGKYHGVGEELVTVAHNGKYNEFDE